MVLPRLLAFLEGFVLSLSALGDIFSFSFTEEQGEYIEL